MVQDIRFGKPGRRHALYVICNEGPIAYISNFTTWQNFKAEGAVPNEIVKGLAHESLHLALYNFGATACKGLDRVCSLHAWNLNSSGLPLCLLV